MTQNQATDLYLEYGDMIFHMCHLINDHSWTIIELIEQKRPAKALQWRHISLEWYFSTVH